MFCPTWNVTIESSQTTRMLELLAVFPHSTDDSVAADKHEGVASIGSELGGTQLQQWKYTMVPKASSIPHMMGDVYIYNKSC